MSAEPPPFTPYEPPSGPGRNEPWPEPRSGRDGVEAFHCPNCGSTSFNPGFIDDTANGMVRWIQGPVERGLLGGLKRSGRQHRVIVTYRCTGCSRLELYAGGEI